VGLIFFWAGGHKPEDAFVQFQSLFPGSHSGWFGLITKLNVNPFFISLQFVSKTALAANVVADLTGPILFQDRLLTSDKQLEGFIHNISTNDD